MNPLEIELLDRLEALCFAYRKDKDASFADGREYADAVKLVERIHAERAA